MRSILNFFNNIYNHKRYLIIFIFFTSIICSLIFLSFFRNIGPSQHRVPGSDYFAYYEPIANSILQGRGFPFEKDLLIYIRPGFPVFLSGVFALSEITGISRLDLVVIFNIIITALSCCFLFLIAKEVFDKRIALIASFLWMSYPFNLWLIKNPNTEVLFILLLYIGFWLYILALKRKRLGFVFFGGIFLGLAILTKWIALFLPIFLILFIFFFLKNNPRRLKLLLSLFILLGLLLTFIPWSGYVFLKTGRFNSIPFFWIPHNVVYGFTSFLGLHNNNLDDNMSSLKRIEEIRVSDSGKEGLIILIKEFFSKPLFFLKLMIIKVFRAWYATSEMWWEKKILMVQILYLSTAFLGLLYKIKNTKEKIKDIKFLLSIVLYFWIITFFSISILRYMIPAMGLVIIFSAITVSIVLDKLVKKLNLV